MSSSVRPDGSGPPPWDCARRSGDAHQRQGATPHEGLDVPQQCPGGQPGLGSRGPEAAPGGGCGGGSGGPGDQRPRSNTPAAAIPGREQDFGPAGRLPASIPWVCSCLCRGRTRGSTSLGSTSWPWGDRQTAMATRSPPAARGFGDRRCRAPGTGRAGGSETAAAPDRAGASSHGGANGSSGPGRCGCCAPAPPVRRPATAPDRRDGLAQRRRAPQSPPPG